MRFRIGQLFWCKINGNLEVYMVDEINKKWQQYLLTCRSHGQNFGKQICCDIAKFEKVTVPELPVIPVDGEIVEDDDRIYIKAKEDKVEDTCQL
ncbi:MAG: hypothetical protein ACLRFE_03915 [Clostridia bacterium]